MGVALHFNKLESPPTKDALSQVWLILACGSGEKDENVKNLRTDRLRMTGDQKSSLEQKKTIGNPEYLTS